MQHLIHKVTAVKQQSNIVNIGPSYNEIGPKPPQWVRKMCRAENFLFTPYTIFFLLNYFFYRAHPRATQQGRAKFGGITAQLVLTQGEIPEEGGTGEKQNTKLLNVGSTTGTLLLY